ncbi:probable cytochrome P450 304a1 [Prorops nasuta]|uniref:probable cytochrome P450 304a1 n=1 Tax=Prorops nasuta TaxID=863751 RepID=UPI0034CE2900
MISHHNVFIQRSECYGFRMTPILIGCLLLILTYELIKFIFKRPFNAPPCIPRLPILGSYPFLLWRNYNFPHFSIPYYTKKYKSKIISLYMGNTFTIVANDYKSIKEIFTKEEFDGRVTDTDVIMERAFKKQLGIFFIDGTQWKEQRRFALRHLRDFGFGRRHDKLEAEILDEVLILVNSLKYGPNNDSEKGVLKDGKALFPDILFPLSANAIWLVMSGEKLNRADHDKLRKICKSAMTFQRGGDTTGGAISFMYCLKYFGDIFGYMSIVNGTKGITDFIKEYIKLRSTTYMDDEERGFVDRYLKKLREEEAESTFTDEQLIMTIVDVMFPALSAVPSSVTHILKYTMHNPNVIKNVQEEIDRVVGTGRLITWDDKHKLPYTEATIREGMRIETLTPFGVTHKAVKISTLGGFTVPANTSVVTNLAGMNLDPEVWGDPEVFRPERFLDDNGELKKDLTMPFGFGHRVCAGETFARYMVFEMFSTLMQNFNFSFVENEPFRIKDKLPGLIVTPKEAWVNVTARF